MKLAVMQPYFLPYLGYFQLIHSVDHFMFFDDVQYTKKSWMGRNRLLNLDTGKPFYIRPGMEKPEYQAQLPTVKLEKDQSWKKVLRAQMKGYKNKVPFYGETIELIEQIFERNHTNLVDFNIESTVQIANWLSLETEFDRYTDHKFWFDEKPGIGEWGLEIAKALKADKYINAPGGESFILSDGFEENNIKLGFLQPYLEPYNQHTSEFVPGLSILDVLLFNGRERTCCFLENYTIKWKN